MARARPKIIFRYKVKQIDWKENKNCDMRVNVCFQPQVWWATKQP